MPGGKQKQRRAKQKAKASETPSATPSASKSGAAAEEAFQRAADAAPEQCNPPPAESPKGLMRPKEQTSGEHDVPPKDQPAPADADAPAPPTTSCSGSSSDTSSSDNAIRLEKDEVPLNSSSETKDAPPPNNFVSLDELREQAAAGAHAGDGPTLLPLRPSHLSDADAAQDYAEFQRALANMKRQYGGDDVPPSQQQVAAAASETAEVPNPYAEVEKLKTQVRRTPGGVIHIVGGNKWEEGEEELEKQSGPKFMSGDIGCIPALEDNVCA